MNYKGPYYIQCMNTFCDIYYSDKIKTANTSNIYTVIYTLIMASLDY